MKNILALLTMVSFTALAAEESNTQKLDNLLVKGKEDGKNVMVIIRGKAPVVDSKDARTQMNNELRKLFSEARNGKIPRSEVGKRMRDVRAKYDSKHSLQLDLSFLNSDVFKKYKENNLLSLNIVANNANDLPDKIKNNFKVKSIPTVILVNKEGKVVHRLVSGKRGSKRVPAPYIVSEYKLLESK